jgi:hypothetical protein
MYSRHTLFGICLRYRNILGFLKIREQPEPPQKNRTAAKKSQAAAKKSKPPQNNRSRRKKIAPPQKNRKQSQQPQQPAATAATTCALAFGELGLMSVLEKAFKNRRTEPTWNNQHSRGYSRRTNEKVQKTEDNRGQLSTSLASNRI